MLSVPIIAASNQSVSHKLVEGNKAHIMNETFKRTDTERNEQQRYTGSKVCTENMEY